MERPGVALVGALAVHALIGAGLVWMVLFAPTPPRLPVNNAIPVQIVSDTLVSGGGEITPSDEPTTEEANTAPVEAPVEPPPPEPTPPAPAPRPTPPRPAPQPTPRPPEKRPPTPPRPQPPRPQPPRQPPQPSFDPNANAGPLRNNPGPARRPPPGGGGAGPVQQSSGPQITAMFQQIIPNWILPCDVPEARNLRIQMDVTLSRDGRITAGPTLISPRSDPVWRASADAAMRALRQTAPFDVPDGFTGGSFRPTFNTEEACRNR